MTQSTPSLPPADDPTDPPGSVLLVDDQPANLLALEAVLGDLGPTLVRAGSGEEALRLMLARDFAVVLLDVRMQGMDGFQTARHVRGRERSRHTPIIFLTAVEESQSSLEEAYSLGAVDYLIKPFVPAILRAKVAAFVDLFRKKEQAERQADQLRLLVQGTIDYAIFMLDPEGRIASWNGGAERLKGYRAEEIVGQHFSRFYPREALDRGWPAEELRQATDKGRFEDEGWRVRKDGSTFWANVVITALRDQGGRLRGFSKVTRDLTDRKQKEEELRQLHRDLERRVEERTAALAASNARLQAEVAERRRAEEALGDSEGQFRTLAGSIPQLAWMARPDGHIFWYNRRWHEYTGTTPEQMEGWGWQSVHDPTELPRVLAHWRAALAGGEPWEDTFPLRRHDGRMRWHLSRAVPVRDQGGRIVRWFGTNTDIADRIEIEEALKEADRRKDQFVMMLAHELRNPLAPIRNGLQLLQVSEADPQVVAQARRMMERQVGHMARIIEDLLDVSRLMQGRVELRPERLDLGRLARTVVEDQRTAFERAGLVLEASLPELPVWVNADSTRLTQVFDNLIENAVKFTERGGTVAVRVEADASRQQAVFSIRDTGAGIEAGLLPRLFETFAQADCSLDRSKGGVGLGLSLVKGLVGLHGGEAQALSEGPGRGAEFLVRLPLQAEPAAVAVMPAAPTRATKRLRVLVVEDNRDAADSLKMLLILFGYDVSVAYTGPSGVEAAKEWVPDVVLCDIGLPGLDGYGVARELRQNPATATTRMIAVTGYGGEEDRRRSQEAGFDAHLTKPADPTALQELLAPS